MHAVWDLRRVNVLRTMLALDADVFLLQELNNKSRAFLAATLTTHAFAAHLAAQSTLRRRRAARTLCASRAAINESSVAVRRAPTAPTTLPG